MKKRRYSTEQIAAALKQVVEQNTRLKKLVAELSLDKAVL
ncbi:transposase [Brucella sp. NM4]|nr:transposase [Brucella sp. NM4]WHS33872.1 transposase [Brucella sp. NM4]